jgi:hypothetical protein
MDNPIYVTQPDLQNMEEYFDQLRQKLKRFILLLKITLDLIYAIY